MREIKFRAKIYDTRDWEYVSPESGDWGWLWTIGDIDTVGQYTGLLDKHGKEIYEGDIVLWRDEEYPIIFDKGAWVLQGSISFASFFDGEFADLWNVHEYAEVVGSIHDEQEPLARESMI